MKGQYLSVVIPAFNEERRILPTVEKVRDYLKNNLADFEIIVVDDGSTDNTASVVKNFGARLGGIRLIQNEKNAGKGSAVKAGVMSSKDGLILLCDADMSTPIEEIDKLMKYINEGFDIAIGSRGLKEADIAVRQPWYREGMGKTFNFFVRAIVMGGIKDTQCGFKLFKGNAAKRIFNLCTIEGFSFDVEVLFIAGKLGYKIKEVPIRWLNSPDSKVRLIKDPLRMFIDLLRIRLYWHRGLYRT